MAYEWVRARIAGAAVFVSMADKGVRARIAGAAAFVSTAGEGAGARIKINEETRLEGTAVSVYIGVTFARLLNYLNNLLLF